MLDTKLTFTGCFSMAKFSAEQKIFITRLYLEGMHFPFSEKLAISYPILLNFILFRYNDMEREKEGGNDA
jgi:hypothetical protein